MRLAVLFDLDGTLIDSLPNITDAANAVLDARDLPHLTTSETVGFVGRGEQVFVDRLIEATELSPDERDTVLHEFMQHYELEALKTVCFEGVQASLMALKEAGYSLGLVTNKPRAPLEHTINAASLEAIFDVVVAGDDLPKRKPDPSPLNYAFEKLEADSCVYVGDSEIDAETAERAGVPFVLFTEGIRTKSVHDLRHTVAFSDFAMLPAIIARMAR